MNCIVIDDELPALHLLADYVKKVPDLNLVGTAEDAFKAMELLNSRQVDLMFLDIQMPELTGINFIKSLTRRPYTVFTTAYAEYALEGYELNVVDYLLKPITFERFLKAVNKVKEMHELAAKSPSDKSGTASKEYIFVKADYKLVKVSFDEINYIQGMSEYVRIFTDTQQIITLQTLKSFGAQLPPDRFLRIHKSYIVPIKKIKAIIGNTVEVPGKNIPIGRNYREKVFEILKG